MSGFLLDTNCISELVRPKPEPRVLEWMDAADETMLHISVITLGEIRRGASLRFPDKRRRRLETWLEVELSARFAGRVLPVDAPVAYRWGLLTADAERRGKKLPVIDALLAATALHYDLTVISRNTKDFVNAQVQVLNPWEG